jgi:hypothetical protein
MLVSRVVKYQHKTRQDNALISPVPDWHFRSLNESKQILKLISWNRQTEVVKPIKKKIARFTELKAHYCFQDSPLPDTILSHNNPHFFTPLDLF